MRRGPRAVKPLVPRGRALRVDRPLLHVASRNDESVTPAADEQEHQMRPDDDTIPDPPEPHEDAHLEATYDDRYELEEN